MHDSRILPDEANAMPPGMTRCPRCGEHFGCGSGAASPTSEAGAAACWCAELPPLQGVDRSAAVLQGCYCAACLRELLARQAAGDAGGSVPPG
ncbi:MAG: cysteine-rich CWC family protein [Sterolibacterium sp.]|nr:cysteine-rich CWC family protein [Sterolibacterium sp.]